MIHASGCLQIEVEVTELPVTDVGESVMNWVMGTIIA